MSPDWPYDLFSSIVTMMVVWLIWAYVRSTWESVQSRAKSVEDQIVEKAVEITRSECQHVNAVPVDLLTGEIVGYLCPDCDQTCEKPGTPVHPKTGLPTRTVKRDIIAAINGSRTKANEHVPHMDDLVKKAKSCAHVALDIRVVDRSNKTVGWHCDECGATLTVGDLNARNEAIKASRTTPQAFHILYRAALAVVHLSDARGTVPSR